MALIAKLIWAKPMGDFNFRWAESLIVFAQQKKIKLNLKFWTPADWKFLRSD